MRLNVDAPHVKKVTFPQMTSVRLPHFVADQSGVQVVELSVASHATHADGSPACWTKISTRDPSGKGTA